MCRTIWTSNKPQWISQIFRTIEAWNTKQSSALGLHLLVFHTTSLTNMTKSKSFVIINLPNLLWNNSTTIIVLFLLSNMSLFRNLWSGNLDQQNLKTYFIVNIPSPESFTNNKTQGTCLNANKVWCKYVAAYIYWSLIYMC